MPRCHPVTTPSRTPLPPPAPHWAGCSRSAERRATPEAPRDFERFERELHALVAEVERDLVAEELAKGDVDVPVVFTHGVPHRRAVRCAQTYLSAAGELRVMRTLYTTRMGDPAECPLELRTGIVEGRWTPLAARQAARVVAHLTPQEGETLFEQLGLRR